MENRFIYIAEDDKKTPLGTCRIDLITKNSKKMGELSWTVSPTARGKNLGQQMLQILAHQIKFPLYAEIKAGNIPSIKIAESIGMTLHKKDNGILEYIRSKY